MHSTGLQKPLFAPTACRGLVPVGRGPGAHRRTEPRGSLWDSCKIGGASPVVLSPHLSLMAVVQITRIVRFNAAHRVYNPALSDEENQRLFGKCNNPNWHGHNYTLEVTVEGAVDPITGFVVNLRDIKQVVEREVVEHVDHKNLNLEVPFMAGTIPSTENFVLGIWRVLAPAVAPARLARLKLWETENQYVEYDGR